MRGCSFAPLLAEWNSWNAVAAKRGGFDGSERDSADNTGLAALTIEVVMVPRRMRTNRRRSAGYFDEGRAPSEAELKILRVIRRIPRGFVLTYGKVAEAAGLPRRARFVGHVLSASPLADGVPWHRVVNATGRISLRGGEGPRFQARRLAAEGVSVDARGRIKLGEYLWDFRKSGSGGKGRKTRIILRGGSVGLS
jgi:methylated-DNA-protein-cysteine methyltransferase related protein